MVMSCNPRVVTRDSEAAVGEQFSGKQPDLAESKNSNALYRRSGIVSHENRLEQSIFVSERPEAT
jgi:hypothetical protein